MKILGLILFVSIFEIFGQASKPKRDYSKARVYSEDLIMTEQSYIKQNKLIKEAI